MVKATPKNVNNQNRMGETALFRACDKGNLVAVRNLLSVEGLDVNLASKSGITPLYKACFRGFFAIVEELLKRDDIDINKRKNYSNKSSGDVSPLYISCMQGTDSHIKVVQLLVKDPRTDINRIEFSGETSFFNCCAGGKVDAVKAFLENPRRIDINNAAGPKNRTPLMVACCGGHKEIVDLLLSIPECDINMSTPEGFTALSYACEYGMMTYAPIVKKLLGDPRIVHPSLTLGSFGVCPLLGAIRTGSEETASLLVQDKNFLSSRMAMYFPATIYCLGKIRLETPNYVKIAKWILATCPSLDNYEARSFVVPEFMFSTATMNSLINSFYKNSAKVKTELRLELGIAGRMAAEVFASVVYHCDGYYRLLPSEPESNEERFYKIAARLPMELQMILCNRLYELRKDSVPKKLSEPAFIKVAEPACLHI